MFFIIVILILVFAIIIDCQNDKHDVNKESELILKLPPFRIEAKSMSKISQFWNLAYNPAELLKSFNYSNGGISVVMQNGLNITAPLSDVYVEFSKSKSLIFYTVKYNNKKIHFYQTTNISKKEWFVISYVLCLAGTTRGMYFFGTSRKRVKQINKALDIINKL